LNLDWLILYPVQVSGWLDRILDWFDICFYSSFFISYSTNLFDSCSLWWPWWL